MESIRSGSLAKKCLALCPDAGQRPLLTNPCLVLDKGFPFARSGRISATRAAKYFWKQPKSAGRTWGVQGAPTSAESPVWSSPPGFCTSLARYLPTILHTTCKLAQFLSALIFALNLNSHNSLPLQMNVARGSDVVSTQLPQRRSIRIEI